MMKHILAAVGTTSLLAASGIALAPTVFAAPAPAVATAAAPAEAPCLPVPAVGLACGALGAVPGTGSLPDPGQAIQKIIESP